MRMTCPICDTYVNTIRSKILTPHIRELYHVCRNKKCGHIFVTQQAFVRTIVPSDLSDAFGFDLPQPA